MRLPRGKPIACNREGQGERSWNAAYGRVNCFDEQPMSVDASVHTCVVTESRDGQSRRVRVLLVAAGT